MIRPVTLEHIARPRTAGPGIDVFAVEDTTAQIVWSALPPGPVRVDVEGRYQVVEHSGGPGACELDGLRPDTVTRVGIRAADGTGGRRWLRTLPTPAGDQLFRFATVNDLHLGRGERGLHGHLPHGDSEAASRPFGAARDAIDAAADWGAELLIVKGDLCDQTYEWTWVQAAKLLGDLPMTVRLLPGNHDSGTLRRFEPEEGAARHGLHMTRGVDHLDVPGLRVLLVDSTISGRGWGAVARHADAVADLAGEVRTGVFVATHHQPQRFRIPWYWPHGIPGPDAGTFARGLVAANPRALASSGHTHRCRVRTVNGLPWSEVAATNHFPGVWAGYRVHEGGIMQVVRRTAAGATLAWSEHTRDVLGGIWALWATGTVPDRCFTLDWT